MTTATVTDLQDAKFFRKKGLPLNTPVEDGGEFSPAYQKYWHRLNVAKDEFMYAITTMAESADWPDVIKRFNKLNKAMERCDAYLGKTKHEAERVVLAWFLVNRAMPFVKFWDEIFAATEKQADAEGVGRLSFSLADVPMWFDPE